MYSISLASKVSKIEITFQNYDKITNEFETMSLNFVLNKCYSLCYFLSYVIFMTRIVTMFSRLIVIYINY